MSNSGRADGPQRRGMCGGFRLPHIVAEPVDKTVVGEPADTMVAAVVVAVVDMWHLVTDTDSSRHLVQVIQALQASRKIR